MALSAGSVFIDVRPDLSHFDRDLRRQVQSLSSEFKRTGDQLGKDLTQGIDRSTGATGHFERAISKVSSSADKVSASMGRLKSSTQDVDRSVTQTAHVTKGFDRSLSSLVPRLNAGASHFALMGGNMRLLKWPALIAGARLGGAALAGLAGSAVALVSALMPITGVLAAIPAGIAALGATVGTATLGFLGIGDAVKALNEQSLQAGGAVGDAAAAHRAAADQIRGAHSSVEASQDSLAAAQRQAQYAQEALTFARRDALLALEDLRDEVERGSLTEEAAELRLAQARQRLREELHSATGDNLSMRAALLEVREAEFDLAETREQNRENQAALNDAERKGIEGSEQVVAARRGIADANRSVQDSQDALIESQRDLASTLKEQDRGMLEASTSATALSEAMGALSPAGREFARQLFRLKPLLDGLKGTAQATLLPSLGVAIERITPLFPIVNRGVKGTAQALGDLAVEAAALVSSGSWRRDFALLAETNALLIERGGAAALNMAQGLRHIAREADPLVRWIGRLAVSLSEGLAGALRGASRSGGLTKFFDTTRERVKTLMAILGDFGSIFGAIFEESAEAGEKILNFLARMVDRWARFFDTVGGRNALKDFFDASVPVFKESIRLVRDVAKAFFDVTKAPLVAPLIKRLRTELLPAIEQIARSASGRFTNALVDLAIAFTKLFGALSGETGILTRYVELLTNILNIFNRIPGGLQSSLIEFAALAAVLKFSTFGFFNLQKIMGALVKGAGAKLAAWVALKGGLGGAFSVIAGNVRGFGRSLLGVARTVIPIVIAAVQGLWALMLAHPFIAIGAAVALLAIFIIKNWDTIKRVTLRVWGVIGDTVKGVWNSIKDVFGGLIAFLLRGFRDFLSFFITVAGGIVDAAATAFGWVPGIGDKIQAFRDTFHDVTNGILRNLDRQVERFQGWGEKVNKHQSDVAETAARNAKETSRAWGEGIDTMGRKTRDSFDRVLRVQASFLKEFSKGIGNVREQVGLGVVRIAKFEAGNLIHYAKGTKDHPGGLAVVGERGPEIVSLPEKAVVVPHQESKPFLDALPGYEKGAGRFGNLLELLYPANDPDHQDHLHYAMTSPGAVVSLGRAILKLGKGFSVTEGPGPFGPIGSGHDPDGYHPLGQAADVNWAAGESLAEKLRLNKLAVWIREAVGRGVAAAVGFGTAIASPRKLVDSILGKIEVPLLPGAMRPVDPRHFKQIRRGLIDDMAQGMEAPGGRVSGNVREWLLQAMQITGAPRRWISPLTKTMMAESGGDPRAVNQTAVPSGQHAQGLMQTIPSTFQAYVPRQLAHLGIFNPIANAAASILYRNARYSGGDWSPYGPISPYANGGVISEPTLMFGRSGRVGIAGEKGPEVIMPRSQIGNQKDILDVHMSGTLKGTLKTPWGPAQVEAILDDGIQAEGRWARTRTRVG